MSVRTEGDCEAVEGCCGPSSIGGSELPVRAGGQAKTEQRVGRDAGQGLQDPEEGVNLMLWWVMLIQSSETAGVLCSAQGDSHRKGIRKRK